jgi:hypothetical protein
MVTLRMRSRFCAAKTVLLFDVTKHPVLGIDNLMEAKLSMAHFIPVAVPVHYREWLLPALIERREPAPGFLSNKKGCNSGILSGFLVGSNRELNG